jgi:hypothetical protein
MATKITFNPFTGNFDYVETGGSGGLPNFEQTFNATTDWGSPSAGYYTITIPAATHLRGANPVIQVFELVGSDYDVIDTTIFIDSLTNAISIKSLQSPDSRFAGKIIIANNI